METILTEQGEGYRTVSLNRPDKLNVFDGALEAALLDAIEAADADEACRALILTGAGRGFCAGADLAATVGPTLDVDLGAVLERGVQQADPPHPGPAHAGDLRGERRGGRCGGERGASRATSCWPGGRRGSSRPS